MTPLIDADVLRYEVGFAGEVGWQQPGFPPFDYIAELLDQRIANICAETYADKPPILFLTGSGNFRNGIAKRQPYKVRAGNKPYHFYNITAYMKVAYDTRVSDGLEADDLMSIYQTEHPGETIICTRDKDLRAVPGWQYGWELGNQPSFGPEIVDVLGGIRLAPDRKSIKGTGLLFFYSQCLTGDTTDSIPGLPKTGPVAAYESLKDCKSELEAFNIVRSMYQKHFNERGDEELLEQGRLLWMTRKLNPDGTPVLWKFPDEENLLGQ